MKGTCTANSKSVVLHHLIYHAGHKASSRAVASVTLYPRHKKGQNQGYTLRSPPSAPQTDSDSALTRCVLPAEVVQKQ
eukprot:COSAG01_NODE_255_length_20171_cov_8.232164_11_plen_78_part_00